MLRTMLTCSVRATDSFLNEHLTRVCNVADLDVYQWSQHWSLRKKQEVPKTIIQASFNGITECFHFRETLMHLLLSASILDAEARRISKIITTPPTVTVYIHSSTVGPSTTFPIAISFTARPVLHQHLPTSIVHSNLNFHSFPEFSWNICKCKCIYPSHFLIHNPLWWIHKVSTVSPSAFFLISELSVKFDYLMVLN